MRILNVQSNYVLEEPKTPRFKMFLLGSLITLPCILGGMVESYSAVALPQMRLNIDEASLFGSAPGFASPIGSILLGIILDSLGRKFAIITGTLTYLVGWLLLFWNHNIFVNILGRMVTGIPTGCIFYPIQVYAVECIAVNDNRLKSSFATWGITVNSSGIFIVFLLSSFLTYRHLCAVAAAFAFCFLILIYSIIPESPTWLFLQGRLGDAEIAKNKLGIFQPILYDERQRDCYRNDGNSSLRTRIRQGLEKLKRQDIYKPLLIMSVFAILLQFTGGFALLAYLVEVIGVENTGGQKEAKISDWESYRYSIICGGVVFGAHLFTSLILHRIGAKKLCIISALVLCLGYAIMSYVSLTKKSNLVFFYANVVGVVLVTFGFHLGVFSVPVAIMSDVFPLDAKGFAGFPLLVSNFTNGVVLQLYPRLYLYFGGYLYLGYLFVGVAYIFFVVFWVPETVGKTPEEIRKQLKI